MLFDKEAGMYELTILTILAILLAPVIALRVNAWRDSKKEAKERKMYIFRTLMAERARGGTRD